MKRKILAGSIILLLMQASLFNLQAQDSSVNSRADELFLFPYANISSLQGSYDFTHRGDAGFYKQFLLRGLYTLRRNTISIRVDLPFASANPGGKTVSGLDDASIRLGFLLGQRKRTFYGARANFKFPTASGPEFGTGKFIFEPSAGIVHFFNGAKGTFTFGLEYTRSFAGDKDRADLRSLGIVANVDRWFKKSYLGYYPTFRYDFISRNWSIPLDLEAGYMFARNWWISGEYILPLADPKTFNYEFVFKLKRVFIRKPD